VVVLALVAVIAAVVILATQHSSPEGLEATIGPLDDFPVGSVTPLEVSVRLVRPVPRVSESADGDVVEVPIFVVHDARAGLLALYAADPHLGCRVGLAADLAAEPGVARPANVVFVNPCHGEQYDVLGRYLAGPAPRGLDRFGITVEGASVVVDIGAFAYGPDR
jgi:Rieske Fe-S protein